MHAKSMQNSDWLAWFDNKNWIIPISTPWTHVCLYKIEFKLIYQMIGKFITVLLIVFS